MLDALLKNKELTWLVIFAGGFYAYTKIRETEKLNLEIKLLQQQIEDDRVQPEQSVGSREKYLRCI